MRGGGPGYKYHNNGVFPNLFIPSLPDSIKNYGDDYTNAKDENSNEVNGNMPEENNYAEQVNNEYNVMLSSPKD
jgi:hypothetical protein